jgi:hypothetical protein
VFPTRVAAEAARGQLGTVVEAFERSWLFTIAPPDWRPGGSTEHVATVGPLPLGTPAAEYTAMYLATTFRPGLASFVHEHPGPEAWFIVSGSQCLETPDGALVGRAGESMMVRGDLPMIIRATGSEIRRNFTPRNPRRIGLTTGSRAGCVATSATIGARPLVGALDRTLNVQEVRLTCDLRAPPCGWTLLVALGCVTPTGSEPVPGCRCTGRNAAAPGAPSGAVIYPGERRAEVRRT